MKVTKFGEVHIRKGETDDPRDIWFDYQFCEFDEEQGPAEAVQAILTFLKEAFE